MNTPATGRSSRVYDARHYSQIVTICHRIIAIILLALLVGVWQMRLVARAAQRMSWPPLPTAPIVQPLTTIAGDVARGRAIVLDRKRGDCVVCHVMPLPDQQSHGTIGPPLFGLATHFTPESLRRRLVDPRTVNPQSVMPAYHKVSGLYAVLGRYRNQPILSAQEIEDVISYLLSLEEAPASQEPIEQATVSTPDERGLSSYRVENRRSGYTYLSSSQQQLQNDEFANPGMLWVERGRVLWNEVDAANGKSCATCHGNPEVSMRGVRTRYPQLDSGRRMLINLEQQINRCRTQHLHVAPYSYESDALLSLTALISYQSRGLPIAVRVEGRARPFFVAGRRFFVRRRGQLDLACTHCHDQNAGKRLRGEVLSQGQTNGFPIYRQLWQTLGSPHRMFAWCNTAVRATALPLGSQEYVNLELYMAWRARGLPVESPAIRR